MYRLRNRRIVPISLNHDNEFVESILSMVVDAKDNVNLHSVQKHTIMLMGYADPYSSIHFHAHDHETLCRNAHHGERDTC